MELALFVYLAGLATNFSSLSTFFLGFGTVAVFAYSLVVAIQNSDTYAETKVIYQKRWVIGLVVFGVLSSLVPSERTMWLMAGAYGTQKLVQSEVGADVLAIINLKIKKELADMKKESSK